MSFPPLKLNWNLCFSCEHIVLCEWNAESEHCCAVTFASSMKKNPELQRNSQSSPQQRERDRQRKQGQGSEVIQGDIHSEYNALSPRIRWSDWFLKGLISLQAGVYVKPPLCAVSIQPQRQNVKVWLSQLQQDAEFHCCNVMKLLPVYGDQKANIWPHTQEDKTTS